MGSHDATDRSFRVNLHSRLQPGATVSGASHIELATVYNDKLSRPLIGVLDARRLRVNVMGKTYLNVDSHKCRRRPRLMQTKEMMGWLETRKSRIQGRGVFARRDIPAGTRLVEYAGLLISKKQSAELSQKQNRYLFTLNGASDLNGRVSWNPARLMNHSCEPNCEANVDDNNRVWIFSIKPIQRGEELTFNYGYSLDDFMNFPCRCGTPSCAGYMVSEELIPIVREFCRRDFKPG
jgi:uncharacterized protein